MSEQYGVPDGSYQTHCCSGTSLMDSQRAGASAFVQSTRACFSIEDAEHVARELNLLEAKANA